MRAGAILTFEKCLYLRSRLRLISARRISAYMSSRALATSATSCYDAVKTCVKQRGYEQQDSCHMFPLISWQHTISITDVIILLLSLAHFIGDDWHSSLIHVQRIQSVDFCPFSCYLKGNYAVCSVSLYNVT